MKVQGAGTDVTGSSCGYHHLIPLPLSVSQCCHSWLSCGLAWSSSLPLFHGCLCPHTPLHLVSSCLQWQWWVLGHASHPVPVVLIFWAFIGTVFVIDLHPSITIIIICPFIVGVGVILSHPNSPVVFVIMAPLPFLYCALSPSLPCHLLVSTLQAGASSSGMCVPVLSLSCLGTCLVVYNIDRT